MLVLSRRAGQAIQIGQDIEVIVLGVEGGQIRLGVRAPRAVTILRSELISQVKDQNILATNSDGGALLRHLHAAVRE